LNLFTFIDIKYLNLRNYLTAVFFLVLITTAGCSPEPYTLGPVKTFDPDTSVIEQPPEKEQYQYWDRVDNTIFHQLEKPLNLNRVGRSAGRVLGVADKRQADNINVLDEPPESSWYTYRHFYNPMTSEELARGPNTTPGPDIKGEWTIFQAKLEGAGSGFFIQDERGDRYLIKFDGYLYPELATSAEVISSKLFYAAGYTVPESVITYFNPDKVKIQEGVTVKEQGREREMTMSDYRNIIENRPRNGEGYIRALASKFVDGVPVGPWDFEGTRDDDPNDRVAHEHRREIRGMRVISSWVNDTDRRDANTMAVYTNEGYIKHYVQDFGNTLGANGSHIHKPIYGQAYLVDPRFMGLNLITLGTNINSWESIEANPPYPSVGYFRADVFKPGGWVPAHPIPAFENMTLRDAYWGAKQVMSFTDEDIRTIVSTGEITNPEAEKYLTEVLIDRRDMIGRYWFDRMNPLDKFKAEFKDRKLILDFTDLGVEGDLYDPDSTNYQYAVFKSGDKIQDWSPVPQQKSEVDVEISNLKTGEKTEVFMFKIMTKRPDLDYEPVEVYVVRKNGKARISGIKR